MQITLEHQHCYLSKFSMEVVLQTVNDNEYQAAITLMRPPFEKSVVFSTAGTVVGYFGNHKTALIQTDVSGNAGDYIIQDAIN